MNFSKQTKAFFEGFWVQGQWLLYHDCMSHADIYPAVQDPWKTPNSTTVSDPFTPVHTTPWSQGND